MEYQHAEILTGKGEITYPNGRTYSGRFENGKPVIAAQKKGGRGYSQPAGYFFIPVKRRVDDDPDNPLVDTYSGETAGHAIPHGHGRNEHARGGVWRRTRDRHRSSFFGLRSRTTPRAFLESCDMKSA